MSTMTVDIAPRQLGDPVFVSQGDVGREIKIHLYEGDDPYIPPSGTVPYIQSLKPSGLGFNVSGTITDNICTFSTTAEMTDEIGDMVAEVRLIKTGMDVGTANFRYLVEKRPRPAGSTDGTTDEVIDEITEAIEEAKTSAIAEIMNSGSNFIPFKLSDPTMIEEGTDINTLTTAGSYYCNTNNIAATLINCPVTVTFRLNVHTIGARDSGKYAYIVQEIMPYNSTTVYRRRCATGSTADVWTFGKWETDLGVILDSFGTNGWQDVENAYFTTDRGDNTTGVCKVFKQGGWAMVQIDGRIIANPSGWQNIGKVERAFSLIPNNVLTNDGQIVRLRVTTNGALQMAYSGTVPAVIGTTFFYPMQVT